LQVRRKSTLRRWLRLLSCFRRSKHGAIGVFAAQLASKPKALSTFQLSLSPYGTEAQLGFAVQVRAAIQQRRGNDDFPWEHAKPSTDSGTSCPVHQPDSSVGQKLPFATILPYLVAAKTGKAR
jgi:hypothetical protein